ncbi:MAG: hypothetical protein AAGF49_03670 [Pseudomonadota bacterium]
MFFRTLIPYAITVAAALPAGSAAAQSPSQGAKVSVELNKMEDRDGICRAYFIVRNGLPATLKSLELDAYLLDVNGIIAERILLPFGPVEQGRTRIFPFDLAPDCASYGDMLIDSIIACEGPSDCTDALVTSSRAAQGLTY